MNLGDQVITAVEFDHLDARDYDAAVALLRGLVKRKVPSEFTFVDAPEPEITFCGVKLVRRVHATA